MRELPLIQRMVYLLLPVPIFFAWFRWNYARHLYLQDVRKDLYLEPIDLIRHLEMMVEAIWDKYWWCWPKPLMRRWFADQLQLGGMLTKKPKENDGD